MTTPAQDAAFVAAFQAANTAVFGTSAFAAWTAAVQTYQTALAAPTTLTDSSGNVWGFGAIYGAGPDYLLTKNGASYGGAGIEFALSGGVAYMLNSTGTWYNILTYAVVSAPTNITATVMAP
jgi:hypothetical protein